MTTAQLQARLRRLEARVGEKVQERFIEVEHEDQLQEAWENAWFSCIPGPACFHYRVGDRTWTENMVLPTHEERLALLDKEKP